MFGKKAGTISPAETKARIDAFQPFTLVDVRERPAYEQEHIAEAICVPLSAFPAEVTTTLKREETTILYDSGDGALAAQAAEQLRKRGFKDVRVLEGGLAAWKAAGFPTKQGFF